MNDYTFPDGFQQMLLVELASSRDAEKLVAELQPAEGKTVAEELKDVRAQIVTQYGKEYAAKFDEAMKASRAAGAW